MLAQMHQLLSDDTSTFYSQRAFPDGSGRPVREQLMDWFAVVQPMHPLLQGSKWFVCTDKCGRFVQQEGDGQEEVTIGLPGFLEDAEYLLTNWPKGAR